MVKDLKPKLVRCKAYFLEQFSKIYNYIYCLFRIYRDQSHVFHTSGSKKTYSTWQAKSLLFNNNETWEGIGGIKSIRMLTLLKKNEYLCVL